MDSVSGFNGWNQSVHSMDAITGCSMDGQNEWIHWIDSMDVFNGWIHWRDAMDGFIEWTQGVDSMSALNKWKQ